MSNAKELSRTERDGKFMVQIDAVMDHIALLCYRKVASDRGLDYDDEDFDLSKFKVTKRQVAESLDILPTSIRSTMVVRCQSFFNAVHEP